MSLPSDPQYQFIDTQSPDTYPIAPSNTLSHFTTRQFTPSQITNTLPITVTIANHGFQSNQALRATKFVTMPFANATGMEQLNNRLFYVQEPTTNTFQLYDVMGYPIDGRSYTAYISGGNFTLTGPTLPVVNPSHFPPPSVPPIPSP